MKIKDVTGDRSFTILKDVIPYIEKFAEKKSFQAIFDTSNLPEDKDEWAEIVGNRIVDELPDLIDDAKDDLVGYFALLEGVTPEEWLADVSFKKIEDGVTDMFSDGDFRSFFTPRLKKALGKG